MKLSVLTPEFCHTWDILLGGAIRALEFCHTLNILFDEVIRPHSWVVIPWISISTKLSAFTPEFCHTWNISSCEAIRPDSGILLHLQYHFGWSDPPSLRNFVIPWISLLAKLSVLTPQFCDTWNIFLGEAIRPHSAILLYLEYLFGRSYPS